MAVRRRSLAVVVSAAQPDTVRGTRALKSSPVACTSLDESDAFDMVADWRCAGWRNPFLSRRMLPDDVLRGRYPAESVAFDEGRLPEAPG